MDDLDHRNLGVQLKLWHLQEDAPGMVFWHPRGYALYRVLEDYVRGKMRRAGYAEVRTPQLLPQAFWGRSGHWDKFSEHMFRIDDGETAMALKPMSCPCHVQIFNKGLRSWRELPIRYAEFGACHRNEPSGSLHGIMRTRAFEQDDAHVFCREQDVEEEVARFIALLGEVYRELGFPDYEVALATRPAVRAGDDASWDWSEAKLSDAARQCGLAPHINPGEGAFYGPKLEFALRDRLGRSWQCGTVQLDSVLPQRLDASYVAPDGSRARPLMIHHAIFGSLGRMIAILLEHHGGVLPFWLSPDQVAVAPISKDQARYGAEVLAVFWDAGIRAVAYDGADTLSRRIVAAQEMAVPVMAIVGGREMRDTAHRPTFRWPRRYPTCRQGCGRALPWPKRCKTCCWRARRSVAPRVGCFTRYEAKNLVQPGTADMSKGWLRRTKCGPDSQPQNDSYCCQSNRKSAHAEPQN